MSFNSSWSQFLCLRSEDTIQLKISKVPTQDFSREDICLFNCASSALQKHTIKKRVNRWLYTLEKRFLILTLDWRQLFFNGWFPISFKAQFYLLKLNLVQFSHSSCPTLCDPMNRSTPGLPVHHQLPEFTQTHAHWVSDAIQPSHPLSPPSPPAPNPSQHQSLFQWVNSSHEVAKVLGFQL